MVLFVEVIFEETFSDQSSIVSLSSWFSDSNMRVRRDVEFRMIPEENARIGEAESTFRVKKEEEVKKIMV